MTNSNHTVEETVARLRELLAKATPGPLRVHSDSSLGGSTTVIGNAHDFVCDTYGDDGSRSAIVAQNDARLIVEAVNALPMLLDALASHSTPAGEDVERVANAIHVARFGSWPVLPMDATDREYCERLARAAIASLPNTDAHDELVEALKATLREIAVCVNRGEITGETAEAVRALGAAETTLSGEQA